MSPSWVRVLVLDVDVHHCDGVQDAFYDSPHESYPFSPAPYGPYPRYAPPVYSGSTAYDQYSAPYRPYAPYGVRIYGP